MERLGWESQGLGDDILRHAYLMIEARDMHWLANRLVRGMSAAILVRYLQLGNPVFSGQKGQRQKGILTRGRSNILKYI
jgi:hypothetical protein